MKYQKWKVDYKMGKTKRMFGENVWNENDKKIKDFCRRYNESGLKEEVEARRYFSKPSLVRHKKKKEAIKTQKIRVKLENDYLAEAKRSQQRTGKKKKIKLNDYINDDEHDYSAIYNLDTPTGEEV